MKVMCTNEGNQTSEYRVIFGEIYTVVEELEWWKVQGGDPERKYYELQERPSDMSYWTGLFSPLSEIDETELVTEEIYA